MKEHIKTYIFSNIPTVAYAIEHGLNVNDWLCFVGNLNLTVMKFQRDRFVDFISDLPEFLDSKDKPVDFAGKKGYNMDEYNVFNAKYDLLTIRRRYKELKRGNNEIS